MFFFLPIGTTRPCWRTPYVTYCLLAANLVVSLLVWQAPDAGAKLFTPLHPSFESWVLSLFAHASLGHYLGNALFLWLFGTIAEDVLGPALFVAFYFGGNLGAGLLDYWVTATYVPMAMNVPWLGASGAIAGLMGLSACCFMRAKVRVWYFVWAWVRGASGVWEIPTPIFGGLWVGWEILQGLVLTSMQASTGCYGGVAHWAHVGGFLAGLAGALALQLPKRISRSDLVSSHLAPSTDYDAYRDAGELERVLVESPQDAQGWRAYGQALELSNREPQAREAFGRATSLGLQQGDLSTAAEAYQEACGTEPLAGASAEVLLQLAFALEDRDKPAEAFTVLRFLAQAHPEARQLDTALVRAGEIARVALHRTEAARECYQELLDACPISPMRALCQEKLRELTDQVGA